MSPRAALADLAVPGDDEPMRAVLVHRDREEAKDCIRRLAEAGYETELICQVTPAILREMASRPPDAIIIDLSRVPSHGKEVAWACLQRKTLRTLPILFAGGEPAKVEAMRPQFPTMVFTNWGRIKSALRSAKPRPDAKPPGLMPHDTPLLKKLGILPGRTVLLIDEPAGIEDTLGPLPEGASFFRPREGADVVLLFVRSRRDFVDGLPAAWRASAAKAKLWVAYPKKTSGLKTDLDQQFVREYAITQGLVDYKICAIDAVWTGMCFSARKT